jgi:hypothetical protein
VVLSVKSNSKLPNAVLRSLLGCMVVPLVVSGPSPFIELPAPKPPPPPRNPKSYSWMPVPSGVKRKPEVLLTLVE